MFTMDSGDVSGRSNEPAPSDSTRVAEMKSRHKQELESLGMTKRPLSTLKYFNVRVSERLKHISDHVATNRIPFLLSLAVAVLASVAIYVIEGPHKVYFTESFAWLRYIVWWVALGIASSIGLGSGLHTFVLYLGPHIAMFTMRATQCGRVDLKSNPYDTAQWGLLSSWASKECSKIGEPVYPRLDSESERYMVPLLSVLLQVQLESVLWGIGTALGELPPYFVSRQARLAGERIQPVINESESPNSLIERLKLWMINHFNNFGFFTVLLFASVPNPLFDVAGILCGQFLVPFWKFFAATLIGKAVIKTHIQIIFIIMVCNPHVLEVLVLGLTSIIERLPAFSSLSPNITAALRNAQSKFSNENSDLKASQRNVVAFTWNTIVLMMMLGFASSIVTSIAQGVLSEQQEVELAAVEAESEPQ